MSILILIPVHLCFDRPHKTYSTQIDQNGLSISAECPVDVASATYQNPSEPLYNVVQTEMIDHGMLKAEIEVVDWKVAKTPKSANSAECWLSHHRD